MKAPIAIALIIALSLLVSLSIFLTHGSHFVADSWYHIGIAKDALASGRIRVWDEYNTDWPLVNLLIALCSLITGLPPAEAGLFIPALAGLAILPILMLVRTLEKRFLIAYLLLTILIFDPLRMTRAASIHKQTAAYFPYAIILYVLLTKRAWATLPILAIALALAHHYTSLTIVLLTTLLLLDEWMRRLRGEPIKPPSLKEPALALIILVSYQAILGTRHLTIGPVNPDELVAILLLLIAMYTLALLCYESESSRSLALIGVAALFALLFYYAHRGALFTAPIPRLDLPALLIAASYVALAAYIAAGRHPYQVPIAAVIAALLVYSLTYDPTYESIELLLKGSRVAILLLIIMAAAARSPTRLAPLLLLPLLATPYAFLRLLAGDPQLGAASIYDAGEVLEMMRVKNLLPNAQGSFRFYMFMSNYLHHPSSIFDPRKPEGLLVILKGDIERGILISSAWMPLNKNIIDPARDDLLMTGGYLYVVNKR